MTTRAELSAIEDYIHGPTPLMRAALDGNTERVKELIDEIVRLLSQIDSNPRSD